MGEDEPAKRIAPRCAGLPIIGTIQLAVNLIRLDWIAVKKKRTETSVEFMGECLLDLAHGRFQRYPAVLLIAGVLLAPGTVPAHYDGAHNDLKPSRREVPEYVEQHRLIDDELLAAEGNDAHLYFGRRIGRWVGDAHLGTAADEEVRYAVYMGGGPFTSESNRRFNVLHGTADLVQVLGVHWRREGPHSSRVTHSFVERNRL